MIPASPPGAYVENSAGRVAHPTSHTPNSTLVAPDAVPKVKVTAITYPEFAAAVRDALRDVHSPDLLARNVAARWTLEFRRVSRPAGAKGIAV